MKKIISSKGWLFINIFGSLCFSFAFIYSAYMCFDGIIAKNNLWPLFLILFVFSFLLLVLFLTALNRLSCIVWCDGEFIVRRGLICGFKYQISVKEIKEIKVIFVSKQDEYVVIIDDFGNSVEGFSKKSYIRFVNSDSNREFYEFVRINM